MRRLKLFVLAAFAICALGATIASVAMAADGQPEILVLSGSITKLKLGFAGEGWQLEALPGGQGLNATGVDLEEGNCLVSEEKTLDTELCHEGLLELTGVHFGKVACRSETLAGLKDPVETALVLVDLHLVAEKSNKETGEVLEPLLVFKILGLDGDSTLVLNCGLVKVQIKGRIGCLLLPGLEEIAIMGKLTILCKQKSGDQITGTCEVTKKLCEELAKDPLMASFGEGFKDAATEFHMTGPPSMGIFIDD
jgi:hypothetical protein